MKDQVLKSLGLSRNESGWIRSSDKIIVDECRHAWKAGDHFIRKDGEGDVLNAVEVSHGNIYYGGTSWIDSRSVPQRAVSRIRNSHEVI